MFTEKPVSHKFEELQEIISRGAGSLNPAREVFAGAQRIQALLSETLPAYADFATGLSEAERDRLEDAVFAALSASEPRWEGRWSWPRARRQARTRMPTQTPP